MSRKDLPVSDRGGNNLRDLAKAVKHQQNQKAIRQQQKQDRKRGK